MMRLTNRGRDELEGRPAISALLPSLGTANLSSSVQ